MRRSSKLSLLAVVAAGMALPAQKSSGQEYCPITGARIGLGSQAPSMFSPPPPAYNAPAANFVPRSFAPPPTNVVPNRLAPSSGHVPPPHNSLPPANVAPNRLVGPTGRTEAMLPGYRAPSSGHVPAPPPVQPPSNAHVNQAVVHLTPANVQEMQRQLNAQQATHLNNLSQHVTNGATNGENARQAQQAINNLRQNINNGTASGKDFANVVKNLQSSLPASAQPAAMNEAGKLAVNQQVSNWLQHPPAGAASGGNYVPGNPGTGGSLGTSNTAAGRYVPGNTGAAGAGSGTSNVAMSPGVPGGVRGQSNVTTGPGVPTAASLGIAPGTVANTATGPGVPTAASLGIAPGTVSNGATGPGGNNGLRGTGMSIVGGAPGNAFGGAGPWAGPGRWGGGGRWGGMNMPMALIPGLPGGLMMPLGGVGGGGGGAMLVGMGQPGDQIVMGAGDPDLAAGLAVAPPGAAPALASAGPVSSGDVILANAAAGPISYNVNQNPFSMQPQNEQTLPAGTAWIVEFDRGNGTGNARYQLAQGYYEFRSGANGWDLVQKNFQTTLDNGGDQTPFSYVLDNQPQTIPAGQSQDLSGIYPPVVQFDNGAGQTVQRRLDGPAYRVALRADRTLDIYPADSLPPGGPAAQPGPLVAASGTGPAPPAPVGTLSAPAVTSVAATSPGMSLPPGFQLFDPVAALTKPEVGLSLPPAFSLFRAAATELAANGK